MLHSYWFGYAGKTFAAVLERDPACAMAYWGRALDLLGNTLSGPPSRQNADAAWRILEEARAVPVKTEREGAWLDAVRAYFRDHASVPLARRLSDYNDEMKKIATSYPDDVEAQVFYALTLQSAASKTDLTYASQLESAAILEKVFAAHPRHPGATHFTIHAYDYAPLATRGIPAARRYAAIAPAVPHARHMPAHIYSMTGLWEDSITSNLSALTIQPDYYHAADFAVYAYLQLAQDTKAAALVEKATTTPVRGDRPVSMVNFTALASMPARLALERADWKAASALAVTTTDYPQADSLTRFSRGLGLARIGDAAGARREIAAMESLRQRAAGGGLGLLGRPHHRADPGGVGVGRAGRGRDGPRRRRHASGRRRRGRQREGRGDGEPPLPDAGAARRPAARGRAARRRRRAPMPRRSRARPTAIAASTAPRWPRRRRATGRRPPTTSRSWWR